MVILFGMKDIKEWTNILFKVIGVKGQTSRSKVNELQVNMQLLIDNLASDNFIR